jgi:hypothetical protein
MDERKYKFLKDLTWDEIIILQKEMEAELAGRKDARFNELVQNFCNAWNALRSEFPTIKVENVCGYCYQCAEWTEMQLDGDQDFEPEDFYR